MLILTATQRDVLEYIMECVAVNRMPPTHREIAKKFKWNSNAAAKCHLLALEKKGYIKTIPLISRGIKITERGEEWGRGNRDV